MPFDARKHMAPVTRGDTVQMVLEPRPDGPEKYAGPIDVEVDKDTIPITAPVDIEKFLAGDADPCHIVAKIPVGWSHNNYYLSERAVQALVKQIATQGLTAARGHVRKEDEPYEFPTINAAWIGAIYDAEKRAGYVRGIIDPAYPELKRHIRAGLVNRVSTDLMVLEASPLEGGSVAIVDCIAKSLDFAPRLKNGYQQAVVAQDMTKTDEDEQTNHKTAEVIDQMDKLDEPKVTEPTEPVAAEPIAPEPAVEPTPEPEPVPEPEPTELETLIASLGADPVARINELLANEAKLKQAEADALKGKVLKDMVKDEGQRIILGRLLPSDPSYDEAKYGVAVQDMLKDPELQSAFAGTSRRADATIKPTGAAPEKKGALAIAVRYQNK